VRCEIAAAYFKEIDNPGEGRVRIRRGEARLGEKRAILITDCADEFCAAGLDGTEQASLAVHQFLWILGSLEHSVLERL
jgi:hypothetical protein